MHPAGCPFTLVFSDCRGRRRAQKWGLRLADTGPVAYLKLTPRAYSGLWIGSLLPASQAISSAERALS